MGVEGLEPRPERHADPPATQCDDLRYKRSRSIPPKEGQIADAVRMLEPLRKPGAVMLRVSSPGLGWRVGARVSQLDVVLTSRGVPHARLILPHVEVDSDERPRLRRARYPSDVCVWQNSSAGEFEHSLGAAHLALRPEVMRREAVPIPTAAMRSAPWNRYCTEELTPRMASPSTPIPIVSTPRTVPTTWKRRLSQRREQGFELLAVQELVAQVAVERLDPGVLPRRSRVDEDRVGAVEAAPSPRPRRR